MLRTLGRRLAWTLFRREAVGTDANGNSYYKIMDKALDGTEFERRMVKFKGGEFDPEVVPPEWASWLSKTREQPPTDDDLAAGKAEREHQRARAEAADAEAAMRWSNSGGGEFSQHIESGDGGKPPPHR